MAEYRGKSGIFFTGNEQSFTPGKGRVHTLKVGGPTEKIKGVERSFRLRGGISTSFRSQGVFAEVTIIQDDGHSTSGQGTLVNDRWSLQSEVITQDLFALPVVATEANTFGGTDGPKDFRAQIEKAAKDGTNLTGSIAASSIAADVWTELRRGATSYETETLVLSRSRTSHLRASRDAILDNSGIYSTGNLSSSWGIPSSILFNLPDDPASAPTNTAWGWRISDQALDMEGQFSKFEDVLSWKFAAWSTFFYNFLG